MNLKSVDDLADIAISYTSALANVGIKTANMSPSAEAVRALLKVCFFASLKREEGRLVEFQVALCSREALTPSFYRFSPYTYVYTLKTFEQARPFTVGELVRLAPACNPDKTLLLACLGLDDRLLLWGLADVGWQPSVVDGKLSELRIRVFGPGELAVTIQNATACNLKDGVITVPEPGLINRGLVYEFFKSTSLALAREVVEQTDPASKEVPIPERHETAFDYLQTVRELAERLQRLRHGGCFLIIPESTPADVWEHVTAKYRCSEVNVWKQLVGKWICHRHRYSHLENARAEDGFRAEAELREVESGLRDSLEALTWLSAVDGAVLINRRFELFGFGCVVKLREKAEYRIFRCEDRAALVRVQVAADGYGTRHRSAFEFCYRFAPSLAIVASHDGGTKFARRHEDDVLFWENTSFNVFSERPPYNERESDWSA
jgi:hypothetical protein